MTRNVQAVQLCFTILVIEHISFCICNLIREARDNRFHGNSFPKGGRAMFVNQSSEARNKSLEVDRCNWSSGESSHKSVKRRSQLEEVVQDCRRWSSNSPVQAESTQVTGFPYTFCLCFNRLLPGFLLSLAFCSLSTFLFLLAGIYSVSPRPVLLVHPYVSLSSSSSEDSTLAIVRLLLPRSLLVFPPGRLSDPTILTAVYGSLFRRFVLASSSSSSSASRIYGILPESA